MSKQKILVVDDENRNLVLMEALLVSMGYDVVLSTDGEDALVKAKEDHPDLILLDIMMPKLDGYEVARRLKSDDQSKIIPIVMVTSLGDVEDRVKALEAGADDFLSKPVERIELVARVKSLLKVKAFNDYMKNYQKELEHEVVKRTAQLKQSLEEVRTSSLESIFFLSRGAEYKDEATGSHIRRVSHFSVAVARQMGLDNEMVENILYAAPMHDVGKIGIPDHILLKPGRLNPEEWEMMKQHTLIGAKILQGSSAKFVKLAEIIALTHHERWDGSGYPKGLKAKDIPLAGRIVAVADVFDALCSKRPYKDGIPVDKAFSELKAGRSTCFDPEVIDGFFAVQEEILAIREQCPDDEDSLFLSMLPKSEEQVS